MMGRALLVGLALAGLAPVATSACGKYGPPVRSLQAAPNPPPPVPPTPAPATSTPPAQTTPAPGQTAPPSGGATPGGDQPKTP